MKFEGVGLFALGTLFGLEGIKLLTSREAKTVYAHCTAGVLRAKDEVMNQVTTLQENCEDIYEQAKAINEEIARKEMEEMFADVDDESDTGACSCSGKEPDAEEDLPFQ